MECIVTEGLAKIIPYISLLEIVVYSLPFRSNLDSMIILNLHPLEITSKDKITLKLTEPDDSRYQIIIEYSGTPDLKLT
jgi:hypothetical protein